MILHLIDSASSDALHDCLAIAQGDEYVVLLGDALCPSLLRQIASLPESQFGKILLASHASPAAPISGDNTGHLPADALPPTIDFQRLCALCVAAGKIQSWH